jgi:hypothetical protein
VFGLLVLIVDAITVFNTSATVTSPEVEDAGMIVAEALAAFYGVLLLLQGSIELVELGIERRGIGSGGIIEGSNDDDTNNHNVDRRDNLAGAENDSDTNYGDESSGSSFDVAL